MKIKILAVGILPAILAGCGSSGGDGDDGDFEVSSGIIDGVELPAGATLAEFPDEVQDIIADFRRINESGDEVTMPTGSAMYAGDFAAAIEDDEGNLGAYLTGDLNVEASFDTLEVDGGVSNIVATDGDGNMPSVANTLVVDADIDGSRMTGSVSGDLLIEGTETYEVFANLDGAFAGAEAAEMLGVIEGQVTNPDNSVDQVSGIFTGAKQAAP
ncbi:hypothetical protein [Yoonia sediminilitoris]|uniref:Transferrin-binding protein B C-lobe/N-lobe beta barrel domain-containing protein n=1 Tax=Yoonia sediminilitoris TaxID=1286148 RepID=A0A2T6KRF1_9RHOB|nr:hypothetical protein [Yoonia sediminilitoris]PUB19134.1 hypothetical protein C8N45_101727 [Yoonia sediminilitoris]RCW99302.1 hypothetical protein DFP92_101727 [Yoonia sediminilitoris]